MAYAPLLCDVCGARFGAIPGEGTDEVVALCGSCITCIDAIAKVVGVEGRQDYVELQLAGHGGSVYELLTAQRHIIDATIRAIADGDFGDPIAYQQRANKWLRESHENCERFHLTLHPPNGKVQDQ